MQAQNITNLSIEEKQYFLRTLYAELDKVTHVKGNQAEIVEAEERIEQPHGLADAIEDKEKWDWKKHGTQRNKIHARIVHTRRTRCV